MTKTVLISQVISSYSPISNCENYNKFLTSSTLDDLKYYTNEISPGGIIKFNLNKSEEYDGIESLHDLLGVDTGSTFELTMVTPSRFNSNKEYSRYQQYHNNVKVEGGGYTVVSIANDGGDPCAPPWALSPFIGSNIDVSTTPTFAEINLDTIFTSENGLKSELTIVQNLLYECNYHLTWRVAYSNNGGKISWVDAMTGVVLKTIDSDMGLNAFTQNYGQRNLDNYNDGTSRMISTDLRVWTYDFGTDCPTSPPIDLDEWTDDKIPTTTLDTWGTVASSQVYQAHWAATQTLPVFDALGLNFERINIGVCEEDIAKAIAESTMAVTYLTIGERSGRSLGLYDIVAHELGHAFLYQFMKYNNIGAQSLHEGISDMIGTYVESVIQLGTTDWGFGDDDTQIGPLRDLEFPGNDLDCFVDVSGLDCVGCQYDRSRPLSHWFYLISEGTGTAIGIENAITIVLEAANYLGDDSDYEEMVEAVMTVVNEEYGLCSTVAEKVGAAWNQICVESELICAFDISGLQEVCEESNSLALSIINSTPGATYTWYFPGEWTVAGSGSQNHIDGTSLLVSGFPTYPWYPQYFTITVAIQPSGETQSINITLKDCDGDDPDCEDVFPSNDYDTVIKAEESELDPMHTVSSEIALLKVYDIMGRLIYEGSPLSYNIQSTPYDGVLILSYFNKYGELVDTEKKVIIK